MLTLRKPNYTMFIHKNFGVYTGSVISHLTMKEYKLDKYYVTVEEVIKELYRKLKRKAYEIS